jgi:UDP:flavonoid glycosyltransferase YjiC (YdhE family)
MRAVRVLVVTAGGSATLAAVAPLAAALRAAGHDVLVTATRETAAAVTGLGLPTAVVCELGMYGAMCRDRDGRPLPPPPEDDEGQIAFAGRGFGRLAAATLPGLVDLAAVHRPDVVVGGSLAHAAPLLAARLGVPWVRHADDLHERTAVDVAAAAAELRPELDAVGLADLSEGALIVEIAPPSLRPTDEAEEADRTRRTAVRWRPLNRQVALEPRWLRRGSRPRVLLTSGSRADLDPALGADFLAPLLGLPVLADADVLVATSALVAGELAERGLVGERPAGAPARYAGWTPLDVVASSCDAVVHHGGGITALTALSAGVPAVALPPTSSWAIPLRRIDAQGASITLDGAGPARVGEALERLLGDCGHAQAARALAEEIAALPPASEVAEQVAAIAA